MLGYDLTGGSDMLSLLVLATAVGVPVDHQEPFDHEPAAIVDGEPVFGDEGVVALVKNGHESCSGVLVSPRVVLTAAHCITEEPMQVYFGPGTAYGGRLVGILDVMMHPEFSAAGLQNDLALLLLDEAVASAEPWPLYDDELGPEFVGRRIRIVGFGHTSPTDDSPHQKRQGTTAIETVNQLDFIYGPSPSQTCMGDSGGPAFWTDELGVEYLIGITSSGDPQCSEYGRDVRVDRYADQFIYPYMAAMTEGAAGPGQRCFYEEHCEIGRCYWPEDAPGIGYCSTGCATEADCVAGTECVAGECRFPAPSPGAEGTPCDDDRDCDSGLCAAFASSEPATCSIPCGQGEEVCGAEAACRWLPDRRLSACEPAEPAPGCSAGTGPVAAPWVLLLLASVLRLRGRRPGLSPRRSVPL